MSTRVGPERSVSPVTLSRARGCLLGGALGDALGYPVEFEPSADAIRSRYGASPPADLAYAGPARISDDTQMTLFTAEGIVRAAQGRADRDLSRVTSSVQRALLRWYETQGGAPVAAGERAEPGERGWLVDVRELHARRAPGNTCLAALGAQARAWWLPTVEQVPNDSKGCGAVMRSAPFGLAMPTREQAFLAARDAAVVTHGHASGYLSAAYLAALVFDLARGVALPVAMGYADALLSAERGHQEMAAAVAKARATAEAGPPGAGDLERIGGGWVGEEALAIALACALRVEGAGPDAVARALWTSVAHGGDSDSTGSITGNLLGAALGVEALPARWLEQLELRDVTDRIASDLYAGAVLGAELDFEAYPPG